MTVWDSVERLKDDEGVVEKHVFKKESAVAEAVLYKYPSYQKRTVICCSTQSGCPVGCRFCGAGDYFVRSLTTEEIVAQPVMLLDQVLAEDHVEAASIEKLQIMFMSMGEPLLNMERMLEAIEILYEKYPTALLLVSTSAPKVNYEKFYAVAARVPTVGLQFSVHESTDLARNLLVPFKAKLSLPEIAEQGENFFKATGRRPYFNYCVHDKNNSQEDVDRLVKLFTPEIWESTVSVICERDETMSTAHARQEVLTTEFMAKMLHAGYSTRRFDPAGQDSVGGGCGQLKYVQSWFKDNPEQARPSVGHGLPILHADDSGLPHYVKV